jgi:hypothetical protein
VQLRRQQLSGASLFPLFGGDGRVRALMVTTTRSARITIVAWRPGLFRHRLLGPSRLDLAATDLLDGDPGAVQDLWHFDPWWVLAGPRYTGHAAVAPLQHTNLPGYAPSISDVLFDGRLERVRLVATGRAADGTASYRRFAPHVLQDAERERRQRPAPATSAARPGWRLRPFWQRTVDC